MGNLRYSAAGLDPGDIGGEWGIDAEDRRELVPDLERARARLHRRHDEGEVGFLDLPDRSVEPILHWVAHGAPDVSEVVVAGIGGSSLGSRAILESARDRDLDGPAVRVTENVDPESVDRLLSSIEPAETLFVVVTKSGTTVETMAKFATLYDRLCAELGREQAAERTVAVTSPDSGALRSIADEEGFESFAIPPNVGGRFSVLSPVGLVPLALAGYPIDALLDGARRTRDATFDGPVLESPVCRAAADLHLLAERGLREVVMMHYGDRLSGLVEWFRQLWAESLGKATNRDGETVHTGLTPVQARGAVDQHSQSQLYMEGPADRLVAFLELRGWEADPQVPSDGILPEELVHLRGQSYSSLMRAELDGTDLALRENGRPTTRWTFDDPGPESVGAFVVAWETITALIGELWNIDAYVQPGVERGKEIAHRRLRGEESSAGAAERFEADPVLPDA